MRPIGRMAGCCPREQEAPKIRPHGEGEMKGNKELSALASELRVIERLLERIREPRQRQLLHKRALVLIQEVQKKGA